VLTAGAGQMSGRFAAVAPQWRGSGAVNLTAHGVGARFKAQGLTGDLALHTRLRDVDVDDRRFDLSGTDLDLTGVRVQGGGRDPWWARSHLDRALLTPRDPVVLRARVQSMLSDPRPLLAFAPAGRSRLVRWLDDLLAIHGVGATADLAVGKGFYAIDRLVVSGGKAEVHGRLHLAGGDERGAFYVSYGKLDVGLEIAGGRRDWKLLGARRWFANYPALH